MGSSSACCYYAKALDNRFDSSYASYVVPYGWPTDKGNENIFCIDPTGIKYLNGEQDGDTFREYYGEVKYTGYCTTNRDPVGQWAVAVADPVDPENSWGDSTRSGAKKLAMALTTAATMLIANAF